jgi:hypothetical protein
MLNTKVRNDLGFIKLVGHFASLMATTLKQVIYPLNLIMLGWQAIMWPFFCCEKLCELLNFNTILHTKVIYFVIRTIIHINYVPLYYSGSQLLYPITKIVVANYLLSQLSYL